jgi:hypothetical protein
MVEKMCFWLREDQRIGNERTRLERVGLVVESVDDVVAKLWRQ